MDYLDIISRYEGYIWELSDIMKDFGFYGDDNELKDIIHNKQIVYTDKRDTSDYLIVSFKNDPIDDTYIFVTGYEFN